MLQCRFWQMVWCTIIRHVQSDFEELTGAQNPFSAISVPTWPAPTVVDWDGDGDLDLLVLPRLFVQNTQGQLVELTGTENPFSALGHGFDGSHGASVVDWDGDKNLDLVVGNESGQLQLFLQTAPGKLVEVTQAENPFSGIDVGDHAAPCVVDWDGDGDLDIVVGNQDGHLYLFHQTTHGELVELTGANDPFSGIDVGQFVTPSVVDWDGDGDLDIVVGNFDGGLKFLQQTVEGQVVERTGVENPFSALDALMFATPSVVDWDGDGDLDLVLGNVDGHLHFYLQTTQGHQLGVERAGDENPFSAMGLGTLAVPSVGDWDGDGDLDIVVSDNKGLHVFQQNAPSQLVELTGAENPFRGQTYSYHQSTCVIDWDGDGHLDIVVGNFDGSLQLFQQTSEGQIVELIGAKNPFSAIYVGSWASPSVGDWDGDGDLDLVVGDITGRLHYFQQTAQGQLVNLTTKEDPFSGIDVGSYAAPSVGDWDGDGDLDLVVGDHSGGLRFFEQTSQGQLVELSGLENPFEGIELGSQSSTPSMVDWDGDGQLDFVVGDADGHLHFIQTVHSPTCLQNVGSIKHGKCMCWGGNTGADCSACLPGYFSTPCAGCKDYAFPLCKSCPKDDVGRICSSRGRCLDNDASRQNAAEEGVPQAALPLHHGNGSCTCPWPFYGEACDQGECLAGFSIGFNLESELYECMSCKPGSFKANASNAEACTSCVPGKYSAHSGQTSCDLCPLGLAQDESGQSGCHACPDGFVPSATQARCIPLTCGTTQLKLYSQCISLVPFMIAFAVLLCAVFAVLARATIKKRIVNHASFLKANHLWQKLYGLETNRKARMFAGAETAAIIEDARQESVQLGINLDYVLTDLEVMTRAKALRHEWRQDGDFANTLGSFLRRYGGTEGEPPEQWLTATKVDAPQDPSFHQLAPILTTGKDAPGFEKICPRDGKLHCSFVDGIREQRCSGKATHFLSWVWSYRLSLPLKALQQWADKNPWEKPYVRIWWCFFCNNQFRVLGGGVTSTKDLAVAFGQNVKGIGKAWMLLDRVQHSTYVNRIWCIFEVYVARKHDIPFTVLLSPEQKQLSCDGSIKTLQDLDETCKVQAQHATASFKEDEENIKKEILEEFGSWDKVNGLVEEQLRCVVTTMLLSPDDD